MQFVGLFLAAIVVEGLISYVNLIKTSEFKWQNICAIILGILIALNYNIDIFDIAGLVPEVPFIGTVLTGILLSRGSNYIYEIVKRITRFPQEALKDDVAK